MKCHFFILLFLFSIVEYALPQERKFVTMDDDGDLFVKTPVTLQYIFPSFSEAVVYYQNGAKVSGLLNYNVLLGEMHFISSEDQSVQKLINTKDVDSVKIKNKCFVPYGVKGEFLEALVVAKVSLLVRRKGGKLPLSKVGGYETTNSSAQIESYSSIASVTENQNLNVKEKRLIKVRHLFYLSSVEKGKKALLIKDKKAFYSIFPELKKDIDLYVQDHVVRFDEVEDVKELLSYCLSLRK